MMKQLTGSLVAATATAAIGLVLIWSLAMPNVVYARDEGHAITSSPPSGKALKTDMVSQRTLIVSKVLDPMTSEAASQASTNQIVLHYGLGVRIISAEMIAENLTRDGYPAVAISGGPRGHVEVFVAKEGRGIYTTIDLNTGLLSMNAKKYYDEYIKGSELNTPDPDAIK